MSKSPNIDWLNENFVCTPFDNYPEPDPEAIELYKKAYELSRIPNQFPPPHKEVTALYEQAAEKGFWVAMHNTAVRYYRGLGVEEDEKKALYWFQEMEKLNIPEGYDAMALVYLKGIGVKKDREKGLAYAHKAAQLGDADALVTVAKSLYPERKWKQANIALKCAIQQGHKKAMWELAANYEVVDEDLEKAYHAYRHGALMGSGGCLRALAAAYGHRGKYPTFGLNRDVDRAVCLNKLNDMVRDDPTLRFPDLDERCPPTVKQPSNRH